MSLPVFIYFPFHFRFDLSLILHVVFSYFGLLSLSFSCEDTQGKQTRRKASKRSV